MAPGEADEVVPLGAFLVLAGPFDTLRHKSCRNVRTSLSSTDYASRRGLNLHRKRVRWR